MWQGLTYVPTQIPGPAKVWDSAVKLFSDPVYRKGPNDQGIGWNILASLQRVGLGFGLAALVGIPAGFMIGRFEYLNRMTSPIISLLRPVSPLAWLPIGLMVFKAANPAAIWVIFICSIWPMIINTATGVQRIPQDYLNVARVLNLSEWKVFTKILFPAVLPYMLTGVKLSIGVAWLVIVVAEMLTGSVGIGFWLWDEWNNLIVEHIIIAIFTIGIVGLLLEQALIWIAKRFNTKQGEFIAIRDINLRVQRGEFTALIGHSGCGKSPLLNLIAGLDVATSGVLVCAGREISGPGPDRGVVLQNHSLLPWLTCFDNVYLAVERVFGSTEKKPQLVARTEAALKMVGLTHATHKHPNEISGGMKQRVGIARALAIEPAV